MAERSRSTVSASNLTLLEDVAAFTASSTCLPNMAERSRSKISASNLTFLEDVTTFTAPLEDLSARRGVPSLLESTKVDAEASNAPWEPMGPPESEST